VTSAVRACCEAKIRRRAWIACAVTDSYGGRVVVVVDGGGVLAEAVVAGTLVRLAFLLAHPTSTTAAATQTPAAALNPVVRRLW
jgi:hypothetical protein